MLFLPECFSFIGEQQGETLAVAEPLDGPLMHRYCELARTVDLWLSLGGFQESAEDEAPGKIFNCHVIVDNEGSIRAVYRKIHL